ncbi:MAG TPA: hypothetical protein VF121_08030, partial [Thermoanaerobaculia bacterium]|nr:hypothetical protein [Thermoanaerobaculia bacterium]
MSLILVVEPEARYIERIHDALGADGWKVQSVAGHDEALAAVASHSPDLILVSARAAGAERVVSAFSRRAGGPGVLVLLPEGEEANGRFGAEDRLGKPFTAQELRLAVKRAAAARREAPSAPAPAAAPGGPKLTSRQIFGDMLAEVEDEIQKKLEQTLSGMLAAEPKAAPAPPPRKAEAKPADDVDALISKTLTGMRLEKELGRSKAGVAPAAKPPVVVAPAAAPAAAPKPSAMEQLEELTRSRRPAPAKAAPAPAEPP